MKMTDTKRTIVIICACILFYCALEHLGVVIASVGTICSLIFPFLLGGCIAFIINVPMKQIEDKVLGKMKNEKLRKCKRILAFLITILLLIGILILVMFVVIPELTNTVKNLIHQVPEATQKLMNQLKRALAAYPQVRAYLDTIQIDWAAMIQNVWSSIQTGAWSVISSGIGVVSDAVSAVVSFFVAIVFAVYILFRKESFAEQSKKVLYALFPEKGADKTVYIAKVSHKTFSNFLSGQCLEAFILGMMFFIVMSILRLPYAVLIGVLIAITALIPIVGAFIGCAVGALLIVMVDPVQALIFLIMFLVLQQVEGNLIYPHVVGSSVGLPSIWVLAAVTLGGKIFGILGMLVFIPLCSVLYTLFREFVMKRLSEKKIQSSKWKKKGEINNE